MEMVLTIMVFNLTEYITNLLIYDPLMFLVLYIIIPFSIVAVIVVIVTLFKMRQDRKNANRFSQRSSGSHQAS